MKKHKIIRMHGKSLIIDEEDEGIIDSRHWIFNKRYFYCGFRRDGEHFTWTIGRCILAKYSTIPNGFDVSYRNGNPLDNRKENLIVTSRRETILNGKHKIVNYENRSTARELPKGVYSKRNKFQVLLRTNGELKYIGTYNDLETASKHAEIALEAKRNIPLSVSLIWDM